MKVALLQINPTVADIEGNAELIRHGWHQAAAAGADVVVTPELALLGYLPRDLLLSQAFVAYGQKALATLAASFPEGPDLLVGCAEPNPDQTGRPLFNVAAHVQGGSVIASYRKSLLPTYDVFDEDRYFEPSRTPQIATIGGKRLGISICEDVWNDRDFWDRQRYHNDPIADLAAAGVDAIVNLSASPFTAGKQALRRRMFATMLKDHRVPFAFCNQVGGNDDLVFDGRSAVYAASGQLIAEAPGFTPHLLVADLDAPALDPQPTTAEKPSEILDALVIGTRDYARKCGFNTVVLGLSGGVDSTIVAAIAAEALGPENVLGVLMPSPFSSQHSVDDSLALAANLGMHTLTLPIAPLMESFDAALLPAFAGTSRDVTEENIQARIRGNLLMAISNKHRSLLLTTGNKSELSVGYCTIYGDMSGGLAVISDVPKMMVYALCHEVNARAGRAVIPQSVIDKAPSAELRPNQKDEDSLPPYPVLDAILELHVERSMAMHEIVAAGFDPEMVKKVLRLTKNAEFKRKQAAPGLKVTDRAFGTGWRMPIASAKWDRAVWYDAFTTR